MDPTTIGLDIAKNVFQAHGVDQNGKVVVRKRFSRAKVLEFFANLPPCLIGMEACPGAHYWARELMKLGHAVKLMAAQYVKAYVKGNKNDGNDAAAICEAVSRPGMRFVAINTEAQQDTQMLHRVRSRLVAERTALINYQSGAGPLGGIRHRLRPRAKPGAQHEPQRQASPRLRRSREPRHARSPPGAGIPGGPEPGQRGNASATQPLEVLNQVSSAARIAQAAVGGRRRSSRRNPISVEIHNLGSWICPFDQIG